MGDGEGATINVPLPGQLSVEIALGFLEAFSVKRLAAYVGVNDSAHVHPLVQQRSNKGLHVNCTLCVAGDSGMAAALAALEEIVAPAARRFKPDIILVSAGYDAHWRDPLAGKRMALCASVQACEHGD